MVERGANDYNPSPPPSEAVLVLWSDKLIASFQASIVKAGKRHSTLSFLSDKRQFCVIIALSRFKLDIERLESGIFDLVAEAREAEHNSTLVLCRLLSPPRLPFVSHYHLISDESDELSVVCAF